MMQLKINKYERMAGLFVFFSLVLFAVFVFFAALEQGWFDRKIKLFSEFKNAEGIRPGSYVQMSGLKIGTVTSVEILSASRIIVNYQVQEKYLKSIREDSVVYLIRPFILSERILDISVGSENQKVLSENSKINSKESIDIMSLLSGKDLGDRWSDIADFGNEMKPFLNQVLPLLKNLNMAVPQITNLTKSVNDKSKLTRLMDNIVQVSNVMSSVAKQMDSSSAASSAAEIRELISNMTVISRDLKQTLPALQAVAPDLPKAGLRAIEALDQAVVLIKAMQKSIFMRSNVKEVIEEESSQPSNKRLPSSKPHD
jgi:phospholipid/cholesterol/gamma-HCH transport system substrate-binding protein